MSESTRITQKSETLLDHVLHNNEFDNHQVNVKKADLTDHFATEVTLPFHSHYTSRSTFTIKEYTFLKDPIVNGQFRETLSTSLNDLDFSHDLNTVFNKFIEILTNTVELFSVTKEIKKRSAANPWINNSIKNAVAKKFKRYKDYLKIPSPKNEELFKKSWIKLGG